MTATAGRSVGLEPALPLVVGCWCCSVLVEVVDDMFGWSVVECSVDALSVVAVALLC